MPGRIHLKGRRNKFGVAPREQRTVDGIVFASKLEATRYSELMTLLKAGQITDLQRQVPFEIEVNGVPVCVYVADFVYRQPAGTDPKTFYPMMELVIEDAKGYKTPEYRLKRKLMKACYGVDIKETYARPRKRRRSRRKAAE